MRDKYFTFEIKNETHTDLTRTCFLRKAGADSHSSAVTGDITDDLPSDRPPIDAAPIFTGEEEGDNCSDMGCRSDPEGEVGESSIFLLKSSLIIHGVDIRGESTIGCTNANSTAGFKIVPLHLSILSGLSSASGDSTKVRDTFFCKSADFSGKKSFVVVVAALRRCVVWNGVLRFGVAGESLLLISFCFLHAVLVTG